MGEQEPPELCQLNSWEADEGKKRKTSLQENTLPKAPGRDLNLIQVTNKDSPACFGKAAPTPYLLRAMAA